jgi:hypothetical protein
MTSDFETDTMLEEDHSPVKPLQPKVYEATFAKYDGEVERRYYQADRLIEAANEADKVVVEDPFTTLVQIKELGPLNRRSDA